MVDKIPGIQVQFLVCVELPFESCGVIALVVDGGVVVVVTWTKTVKEFGTCSRCCCTRFLKDMFCF